MVIVLRLSEQGRALVPKLYFSDPKESETTSPVIRGYITVMATAKFT
jgi:hypothetical protein